MLVPVAQWRGMGRRAAGLSGDATVSVSPAGCTVADSVSGATSFFPDCALPAGVSEPGGYGALVLGGLAALVLLLMLGGRR